MRLHVMEESSLEDGAVRLSRPKEMDADEIDELEAWLFLIIRKLRRRAKGVVVDYNGCQTVSSKPFDPTKTTVDYADTDGGKS